MNQILVFLVTLLAISKCDQCLDPNGTVVSWWVKLVFPKSVPGGFAYFDSSFWTSSFVIHPEQQDQANTPLVRTFDQINTLKLQSMAWNDQNPDGKSSSSKAHAKGVIGFNQNTSKGFYIVHSIPQYPAFNGFTINTTISANQKIYGQHIFCLSIDGPTFYDLISKILPIRPFFYAQNFYNPSMITDLIAQGIIEEPDYKSDFTYKNVTKKVLGFSLWNQMMFIFKNGAINASIFEDGLSPLLKSPLVAQTWGRPLQPPFCPPKYPVLNIKTISLSPNITWTQTQDHSKWAYAENSNYCCFGDMNRMTSQWKRGGAFYCVRSRLLRRALGGITGEVDRCQ